MMSKMLTTAIRFQCQMVKIWRGIIQMVAHWPWRVTHQAGGAASRPLAAATHTPPRGGWASTRGVQRPISLEYQIYPPSSPNIWYSSNWNAPLYNDPPFSLSPALVTTATPVVLDLHQHHHHHHQHQHQHRQLLELFYIFKTTTALETIGEEIPIFLAVTPVGQSGSPVLTY